MKIGLIAVGLNTYWHQFGGLRERLDGYRNAIKEKMEAYGGQIVADAGMVDDVDKAHAAAALFRRDEAEVLFIFISTYALSSTLIPFLGEGIPVVLLNLQPAPAIDYARLNGMSDRGEMTGEWLANCQACSLPEFCSVFNRAGTKYDVVTGYLDDAQAWAEIYGWIDAAKVACGMRRNRMGLLGNYYGGMVDVYSDLRLQSTVFGTHAEILEMCELHELRRSVTQREADARVAAFGEAFVIDEGCTREELERAARTSVALDKLAEAHRLGMKVLLDWVANHTARDARWVTEKPASWYERDASGEPAVPWDWSDTAKLNYADRDVWRAQADAMEFWLTQHDVDGFRCDMAMLVPIEFWNETSLRLRRVKPDLFMLAEAEERNLFEEGAFDACYAWRMHHLMNDVARQRTRVTALRDYIYADRDDYPDSAMRLAFTSNHDENSWNGSEFSRLGDAREIMAVFTFVVPRGLPLIYTGQEIGYDHSFAFFDRDPIPRYEANAFTGFYRRLTALRHDNPALAAGERGGAMTEIRNNAEDCLMTLVRETADNRVVAVMNLSPYAIHADYYTGIYAGMYTDAMTGEPYELRGRVEEDMAPWSYRILCN